MLQSLSVKNFALIKEMHFKPEAGLNVITGETGAGKSIMLGALGLVLGNRAETGVLMQDNEKCVVEAIFHSADVQVKHYFEMKELDFDKEIILRREISSSGKSRAFINDTPVMLGDLKELGALLLEIHTQNTNLLIKDRDEQLRLLDDFGTEAKLLQDYRKQWKQYSEEKKALEQLQIQIQKALAERDYLQFQFDELDRFAPQQGEEESLIQQANALTHVAEIAESCQRAWDMLTESEDSLYSKINSVRSVLKPVQGFHAEIKAVYERLEQMMLEVREFSGSLRDYAEDTQQSPENLENINGRIATMQLLLRKHGVQTTAELLHILNELNNKLQVVSNADSEIQRKEKTLADSLNSCIQSAEKLHQIRQKSAAQLCENAMAQLQHLGMPKAKLRCELTFEPTALNANGATSVQLLFNANGNKEMPLEKVASGGEVSRLNFCFKAILAGKKDTATIIFDEADTGVSGEVALRFGEMMHTLGNYHQIVTITHLPQVAAKGQTHFLVYKSETAGHSFTQLRKLDEVERIANIASMLSGKDPGKAALENARELLGLN